MCAGAIINARIPRVVFGAPDLRFGAFGSLLGEAYIFSLGNRIYDNVGITCGRSRRGRTLVADLAENTNTAVGVDRTLRHPYLLTAKGNDPLSDTVRAKGRLNTLTRHRKTDQLTAGYDGNRVVYLCTVKNGQADKAYKRNIGCLFHIKFKCTLCSRKNRLVKIKAAERRSRQGKLWKNYYLSARRISLARIACKKLRIVRGIREFPLEDGEDGRWLDLISVNGRYVINVMNAGFDCDVVAESERLRRRRQIPNGLSYIIGVGTTLTHKETFHGTLKLYGVTDPVTGETHDEEIERDFLLAAAANMPYYGGGFKAAPAADPAAWSDFCWGSPTSGVSSNRTQA